MSHHQTQITQFFYLNRTFLQAMKVLSPIYSEKQIKMQFIQPNRIKASNWSDDSPLCKKFQLNFNKVLNSANVMKINQPQKKIERVRCMRKWKKLFQIPGLNIIIVKKNYGNVYYLIGCASQLQLYQVLKNIEKHSYKTFSGNYIKFLYKPAFETLISSKDFQILAYNQLKITSTQMRFITVQNQNKKKAKYIQLLFQLQDYISTKHLVDKFKQFLKSQFFACILTFNNSKLHQMKRVLQGSMISGWKILERNNEEISQAYLVIKMSQAKEKMLIIMSECGFVQHIRFLKGLGPTNEQLKVLLQEDEICGNQDQLYLRRNFTVKGNASKNPNEISICRKEVNEECYWGEAIKRLVL